MSTQLIHVLTIVGRRPADDAEAVCESLLATRLEVARQFPDECEGPLDFTRIDELGLERFARAMLDRAYELPVYGYSQFVQNSAMSCHLLESVTWPDGRQRILHSNWGLSWLRSADYAHHRADIKRQLRRKLSIEYRAFLLHLELAMANTFYKDPPSLVLIIDQCIGGTRVDFEVNAAMDAPLGYDADPQNG